MMVSENRKAVPDPKSENSSTVLVQAIVSREPGADAELVSRYQGAVSAIITGISPWNGAIEDLVQETFRLAIEKIRNGEVREPERLPGFVCGLARNLALEQRRRDQRAPNDGNVEPAAVPDHLTGLLKQESERLVRELLREQKPERDREILFRFYLDEEDKDRICRDLDLTSLHFNRVLYRARERFRDLWNSKYRN
jgi:RNA polymerase sigma-70 factor (ECF subfamily)